MTQTDESIKNVKFVSSWMTKLISKFQELSITLYQADMNRHFKTTSPGDANSIFEAYVDYLGSFYRNPHLLFDAQAQYFKNYAKLWQNSFRNWLGEEKTGQKSEEDKRFKSDTWQNNPLFSSLKDFYLGAAESALKLIEENKEIDKFTREKLVFYTKQFFDALSPTNFLITNPDLLTKTINSKGENLLHGIDNLLDDIRGSKYTFFHDVSDAFKVGVNVAITPGKVVFQNKLFELLQYQPTTKEVHKLPILIIPPWINKYYILDLSPNNSFVKWLVDKGHTVFMVSWANPDGSFANIGWDNYVQEGLLKALDQVMKIQDVPKVNVLGFCIGGTLLAITNAYLAALKKEHTLASCTFLMTLLDFRDPGNIGVFIDESQIEFIEDQMKSTGYLDGYQLSSMFNMLKANELIWTSYVKQYLEGENPPPSDLLFWNSDPTNLPAKMHSEYLRWMYLDNLLIKPGKIKIAGIGIDLTKITTHNYFIAAEKDHIVPWISCFSGLKHIGGDNNFTLTGSGHVVGAVNHPQNHKYYYKIFDKKFEGTRKAQLEKAHMFEGSWWTHWEEWLRKFSGSKTKAKNLPTKNRNSPGSYVFTRIEDIHKLENKKLNKK